MYLRSACALFVCLFLVSTVGSAESKECQRYGDLESLVTSIERIDVAMSGECFNKSARPDFERLDVLLKDLHAEDFSLSKAMELAELTRAIECSLSTDASKAFAALKKEAAVRRLDASEFSKGLPELVTPQILPGEWEALLVETGHSPDTTTADEKAAPLILGCVVAAGSYLGSTSACLFDVDTAEHHCQTFDLCHAVDRSCCYSKGDQDRVNCLLSGGLNGPDNDYELCCP